MRLGKRIGLLIRASLGRWRRPDQDPMETALSHADKVEARLEQLGERLNRALARQTQLESQLRQAKETAQQWDRRADEALLAGDEMAAREAVRHKLAYTKVADDLQTFLVQHTTATKDLQSDLTKLESRLTRERQRARTSSPPPSPAPTRTSSQHPARELHPSGEARTTTPAPSSAEETPGDLETLQERMSQVWSDEEIESELDAIKNRLSAGRTKGKER